MLLDAKLGQDVAGLVITFSDRVASIAGKLVDAGGPSGHALLDRRVHGRSEVVAAERAPDSIDDAGDGRIVHRHRAARGRATRSPPRRTSSAADLADPAVLSQLLASAYKVTLAEGERKTQDLRVGR